MWNVPTIASVVLHNDSNNSLDNRNNNFEQSHATLTVMNVCNTFSEQQC